MDKNGSIHVHHVTRVEGHGDILVELENGNVKTAMLKIVEAPRFFEAFVRGRHYEEVAEITSRICGICSVGHTLASLQATEDALGIQPSPQTIFLRKILNNGEQLQSHVLHVCFLILPDLLGKTSVFTAFPDHPDAIKIALKLKRIANDLCDCFGGRTIHPNRTAVGGFYSYPKEDEIKAVLQKLKDAKADLIAVVDLAVSLAGKIPNYTRETEYISLYSPEEYAFHYGDLKSSVIGTGPKSDYLKWTNERTVEQSSAKWTKFNKETLQVGAMARVNNNFDQLNDFGKAVAAKFGFQAPCHNPYFISVAQLIETAHCWDDTIEKIEELLTKGIKEEARVKPTQYSRGIGAVEVPRGLLVHDYTYGDDGRIIKANCIIPTNQNIADIDANIKGIMPSLIEKDEKEIELTLEMMVRAYDPCISCSVHDLKVKFVNHDKK